MVNEVVRGGVIKKREKKGREAGGKPPHLAQVKLEWQPANGLLGNFMGVVKWLSSTCQLQTACHNATQAFPLQVVAVKTQHESADGVWMRIRH